MYKKYFILIYREMMQQTPLFVIEIEIRIEGQRNDKGNMGTGFYHKAQIWRPHMLIFLSLFEGA